MTPHRLLTGRYRCLKITNDDSRFFSQHRFHSFFKSSEDIQKKEGVLIYFDDNLFKAIKGDLTRKSFFFVSFLAHKVSL